MALPTKTLDLIELVQNGRYFAEKRGDMIHIIDSVTGLAHAIYADPGNGKIPSQFVERALPDGTRVWSQEHANLVSAQTREIAFNPVVVDIIMQKVAEGSSLTKVLKEPGFPSYNTFCRWRRQHPWIEESLAQARMDRGETLRDSALDEAMKVDEDTVGSQTLKHDALKWAAGVDNPRYSPKAKIEATLAVPTQIIVNTGIDREPREVTPVTKGEDNGD